MNLFPVSFDGCPSFFRGCCRDASYGGTLGYDHAGHELMRHVRSLVPYHVESDEAWGLECDQLDAMIEADDRAAVLDWFLAHYPRCMARVPRRRRESFIRGAFARAAIEAEESV